MPASYTPLAIAASVLVLTSTACQIVSGLSEYAIGAGNGPDAGDAAGGNGGAGGGGGAGATGGTAGSTGACPPFETSDGPEPIVTGLASPHDIAIDGDRLVWVETGLQDAQGRISSMPRSGGCIQVIATGQVSPFELAISEPAIFWTQLPFNLTRWDRATGMITKLPDMADEVADVATDEHHVYWSLLDGGKLLRAPLDGTGRPETAFATNERVDRLDVSDPLLVFALVGGGLTSISKGAPLSEVLVPAGASYDLGSDADAIYLSRIDTREVVRVSKTTREVTILAEEQPDAFRIAVPLDGDRIYWTRRGRCGDPNEGTGSVIRGSKLGLPPEDVASGLICPWGIAMDDEYVYWSDAGQGTIWRARR